MKVDKSTKYEVTVYVNGATRVHDVVADAVEVTNSNVSFALEDKLVAVFYFVISLVAKN